MPVLPGNFTFIDLEGRPHRLGDDYGLCPFPRYLGSFLKIADILRGRDDPGVDDLKNLLAVVLAVSVGATAITNTHVLLLWKDAQGQRTCTTMNGAEVGQVTLLESREHARVALDQVAECMQFRGGERSLFAGNHVP